MTNIVVQVKGMTCGHCNMAIERAVSVIDGVRQVSADFNSGRVDVTFDATTDEPAVRQAIEDEGYDVVSIAIGER